jgi:hypothetical protein
MFNRLAARLSGAISITVAFDLTNPAANLSRTGALKIA